MIRLRYVTVAAFILYSFLWTHTTEISVISLASYFLSTWIDHVDYIRSKISSAVDVMLHLHAILPVKVNLLVYNSNSLPLAILQYHLGYYGYHLFVQVAPKKLWDVLLLCLTVSRHVSSFLNTKYYPSLFYTIRLQWVSNPLHEMMKIRLVFWQSLQKIPIFHRPDKEILLCEGRVNWRSNYLRNKITTAVGFTVRAQFILPPISLSDSARVPCSDN